MMFQSGVQRNPGAEEDRKRQWYEENGFLGHVITSQDGPDGSIDAAEIERIARKKILLEG
jgi:hypothetical protein